MRENKGSARIDGITFEMIEEYGVEEYLLDIQEDLQNKKYRSKSVKRVYIPKSDGKQRPFLVSSKNSLVYLERLSQKMEVETRHVLWSVYEAGFYQMTLIRQITKDSDNINGEVHPPLKIFLETYTKNLTIDKKQSLLTRVFTPYITYLYFEFYYYWAYLL